MIFQVKSNAPATFSVSLFYNSAIEKVACIIEDSASCCIVASFANEFSFRFLANENTEIPFFFNSQTADTTVTCYIESSTEYSQTVIVKKEGKYESST